MKQVIEKARMLDLSFVGNRHNLVLDSLFNFELRNPKDLRTGVMCKNDGVVDTARAVGL